MKGAKEETKGKERSEILDRFARKVVERRLSAPAILFLESTKPLSFLGNQTMVFFQPIVQSIFTFKSYDDIMALLEDRENVERLLRRIEELEAEEQQRIRKEKRLRKKAKRAADEPEEGADE
jgi:hypothetical protein